MHVVPQRLVRLSRTALPAVALLGLALVGCGEPVAPSPSAPPASSAPASAPASQVPTTGTTGSDGLTVRYLGEDGTVKTVGVEDFPR